MISVKLHEDGATTRIEISALDIAPDLLVYQGRLFYKWSNAGPDDAGCWRYSEEETPYEVRDLPQD